VSVQEQTHLRFFSNLSREYDGMLQSAMATESAAPTSIVGTDSAASTPAVTEQTVVTFMDESLGMLGGESGFYNSTMFTDITPSVDLQEFLSRPVRISSLSWTEVTNVGVLATITPWASFFNDSRIRSKLNNYAFVRANLKIKILINASPFYYGAAMLSYQPMQVQTPSTIINDAGTRYLIPYSQRPHIWIYPQSSEGGEMTLPYFNVKNISNAQSLTDLQNLGQLSFIIYAALQSANGAVGSGVSVEIYAWAEDVVLSGASAGLALQAGKPRQVDEYGLGVVSAPATALARVAAMFRTIPFISPFATATEIGASAVGAIARIFGFTNVPVICDAIPVQTIAFPNLSTTDVGYPLAKLSLDSKNELTIDPRSLGIGAEDELAIADIVRRESYLTTTTWSTTNMVDDILFTSVVTPVMYDIDASTFPMIYMTPMCMVSQLFGDWRGDIVFRFRFICTPYHKGRVRFSYDPSGYSLENIVNDVNTSPVVFTKIVDLGKDSDVELVLPYQQATAWLQTGQAFSVLGLPWNTTVAPPFLYNPVANNGTITLRVLTILSAPVATSSIKILVSVRGADTLEFANPVDPPQTMSTFAVQRGEAYEIQSGLSEPIAESMQTIVAGKMSMPDDNRYRVNFGEAVGSLRQLMRRFSLSYVYLNNTPDTNVESMAVQTASRFPMSYGYDPTGIHSAKGLVATTTNFPFNFVFNTPYNWIVPCFIAQRGSMNWIFNVDGQNSVNSIRMIRRPDLSGTPSNIVFTSGSGTDSGNSRFYLSRSTMGGGGQALTSQWTNAGLNVALPNYNQYRWQNTAPENATQPSTTDGSDRDFSQLEISFENSGATESVKTKVWKYAAIGVDFGCYFFLNVPTRIQYPYPTAN